MRKEHGSARCYRKEIGARIWVGMMGDEVRKLD